MKSQKNRPSLGLAFGNIVRSKIRKEKKLVKFDKATIFIEEDFNTGKKTGIGIILPDAKGKIRVDDDNEY